MEPEGSLMCSQEPAPCVTFRKKLSFYGELLASRSTPKLEDHPMSAVRDCLFYIFVATLHPQPKDVICRGDLQVPCMFIVMLSYHLHLGLFL